MPGPLLHVGATVKCAHQGEAMPTLPSQNVFVSGQPIVTQSAPYTVAGCILPPPPTANGPCVTAQFSVGATRVMSNGQPVLLMDSLAICQPTGTPLAIVTAQERVIGT